MKKTLLLTAILSIFCSFSAVKGETINLKDVTGGAYSAEYFSQVKPLSDGVSYVKMSANGKQIEKFSFLTGQKTGVLFDVNDIRGEKIERFDSYILSPDERKILICTKTKRIYRRSFTGEYYIYNVDTKRMDRLSENGPQQSPVWSKDGNLVAFVRENNIFLIKLLYDNSESQVTRNGKKNEILNGIPDWVNEEEFGFNSAIVFSKDGTMLCFLSYDESDVKTYALQEFQGDKPKKTEYATYPGAYSYKYPKAGEQNARILAWSYDIVSHKLRQLQVPVNEDGYIVRLKEGNAQGNVIAYTMNRHQDDLRLYDVNPRSTVARLLLKETSKCYVKEEVLDGIRFQGDKIIVPSDRDGYMQLYLYTAQGNLVKRITEGGFDVTEVYGIDKDGTVYYQAAKRNALSREVYATTKSGKTQCLTPKEGTNRAVWSSDFKHFLLTFSDKDTPYRFSLCNAQGKETKVLLDNAALKTKLKGVNMPVKEFFQFTTSEGVTLNGVIIKPKDFDPAKKYPVVMWQYAGPGSQQVVNSWSMGSMYQGAMFDAYLTEQGFIVACVDGRGTGARGSEFEKSVYLTLGQKESSDQVEAALYLGSLPYVDKERIGIWGWSYGGFNTLMSLSEGRKAFRCGVAVAPPTSWRYYDTIYTERFMRTPQENAAGYDVCPISKAKDLSGSLLICHGLADDNVHVQNTFEYTEALVQQDKDFKLNLYTNRNHSIYGGNTRLHLFRQIAEFFKSELLNK